MKPYSLLRGTISVGNLKIECHHLSDNRRVFSQREIVRLLAPGVEGGNLGRYLARNPLINKDVVLGLPIKFNIPGTQFKGHGYQVTTLIDICESYIQADERGLLKVSQKPLARQSEVIMRACAKLGIVALVDEATGYQKVRHEQELQFKFQVFIADDMQEWVQMFPTDFWLQLARLEGMTYSPKNRPLRWGRYVMMFVYDAIDEDVGNELRNKNPDPHFRKNHHQWLKDFGREKVREHIEKVIVIMKLCVDMDEFRAKFDYVFNRAPMQLDLDGLDSD